MPTTPIRKPNKVPRSPCWQVTGLALSTALPGAPHALQVPCPRQASLSPEGPGISEDGSAHPALMATHACQHLPARYPSRLLPTPRRGMSHLPGGSLLPSLCLGPSPSRCSEPQVLALGVKAKPSPIGASPGSPRTSVEPTRQPRACDSRCPCGPAVLGGASTFAYLSGKAHESPGNITILILADGETEAQGGRAKVPQLPEAWGDRPDHPQPTPFSQDQHFPSCAVWNSRLLECSREDPNKFCGKETCLTDVFNFLEPAVSHASLTRDSFLPKAGVPDPQTHHSGGGWGRLVPLKGQLAMAGKGSS